MGASITLLDHISELRKRLFLSVIVSLFFSILVFVFYDFFLSLALKPIQDIHSSIDSKLFFVNSFYEGFTTKFKFSFLVGVVLALPIHIFNLLKFIFPGLKSLEKKVIILALISSFFLSFFCLWLCYFKSNLTAD